MNRPRALCWGLVALVAAVVLAGCGGDGSTGTAEPSRSQAARPEPTREPVSREPGRSLEATISSTRGSVAEATSEPAPTAVPAPPAATSEGDDSSPWVWVVLAGLVVAGVATYAAVRHRSSSRAWDTWLQRTRPAVEAAQLSRGLLPAHGRDITDLTRWAEVRAAAEQAAGELGAAAAVAPRPEGEQAARAAAESLSGLAFALESDRLMQAAQPPPSADRLAEADALTRTRAAGLDAALARLDALVGQPVAPSG